jgi:hypothetical protein
MIERRRLETSNYKRNPCISKFYSPQLALCHSGLSNALVPQSQFRAVKPYFTGSAYYIVITDSTNHYVRIKIRVCIYNQFLQSRCPLQLPPDIDITLH